MTRGRGLAPLVGAGMAAVAAGSLVMFSLLAQQTALSPAPGNVIVPRGQEGSDNPPVLVPAPENGSPAPTPGDGSTLPIVIASATAPAPTGPPSDEPSSGATTATQPDDTVLSSLDVSVRLDEAFDFRGPLVDVRPPGPRPGSEEPPKGGDEEGDERSCPGRPDKDHARGGHPYGGPPACGNPHGGPPGQLKKPGAGAAHVDSSSAPGNSGGHSASSGPPAHANDHSSSSGGGSSKRPSPPPNNGNSGGSSSGGSSGSSGGSSHPQGGPPGQAKKSPESSSSGGGPGNSSGHPRGGPPGQAKK